MLVSDFRIPVHSGMCQCTQIRSMFPDTKFHYFIQVNTLRLIAS